MPDISPSSKRFRRLSKEGAWIVIGHASAVLGSLAIVRVLTELLDPAAYGELALGMTVASAVNQIVTGPLINGVARFYAPAQEQNDVNGYLHAVRHFMSAATMVIAAMMLLTVTGLLVAAQTQWIGIATAALVFATLTGYNGVLGSVQNAARQRSIVALHQGIESWARLLVAACLLLWLGATSTVAMAGYAMGAAIVLGSQYVFFRKTLARDMVGADQAARWHGPIWQYSWPFGAWGIFSWAQQASERWALEIFVSTQEVGLYAVLFQLGYYPMSLVSGMAMQFLGPIFYQRAGDANDNRRNQNVSKLSRRLTLLTLAFTGGVFLAALIFHTQIFRILVAREYVVVSYLLPWMLLAGGIYAAGQTIALDLMSQMKTRAMVLAKIATSSLGVLFNFGGAYFLGLKGIAVAMVLSSILYSVWIATICRRTTSEETAQ